MHQVTSRLLEADTQWDARRTETTGNGGGRGDPQTSNPLFAEIM